MRCRFCSKDNPFAQKLGRCKRCMAQLTVLNLILWPLWLVGFEDATSVWAITVLFFAGACAVLLSAHVIALLVREDKAEGKI
ncbi:DUF3624 domain-containing protein [Parasalinivibrio latis]|uniref:DUF3624 domain-containing protein n=1 Tax=Parasalinivibrio latis TaxID=2952610 RepID=UPI0030DDF7E7